MNRKQWKKLLNEQTSTFVGGHFGRGGKQGKDVDDIYAGGYVATQGVIDDLEQQLKDRKRKRKEMENAVGKHNVGIENPLGGHHDINTPALLQTTEYLETKAAMNIALNADVTPVVDSNMMEVEQEITYDSSGYNLESQKYKNDTNSWETIETPKLESSDYNLESQKYKNETNSWKNIELDDIYDIEVKKDTSMYKNETNSWKYVVDLKDIKI